MPNLVGIGLSQVPTNSMLGGLAYQDPEHASIKDLDLKNLSQINSEIANTAVDVFVYDTRKDSDGGAWRKRTQDTSWYNESLGTTTRGTRREFPAVAVIVAEVAKVTIYDGDDPDLPMWMVFNQSSGSGSANTNHLGLVNVSISSVSMLNGILCVGFSNSGGWGISEMGFVSDTQRWIWTAGIYKQPFNTIAERHVRATYTKFDLLDSTRLRSAVIRSIAMKVLPNAPIDDVTKLAIPTIAVGTDDGIGVIKDDGIIFDLATNGIYDKYTDVDFGDNNRLYYSPQNTAIYHSSEIPSHDRILSGYNTADPTVMMIPSMDHGGFSYSDHPVRFLGLNGSQPDPIVAGKAIGSKDTSYSPNSHDPRPGLTLIDEANINPNSAVAYVTTSSNTGWIHGDIQGVYLSDVNVEDDVELITNGTFDNNITGWTVNGGGSTAISSGQVQITNSGTTNCSLDQTVTTVVGKTYAVSATITPQGGGPLPRLYVGNNYVQVASNSNSAQTVTLVFRAYSTSTIISINANTNVNNAVTLADNVSMKLTNDATEIVTNGYFNSDVSGWTIGSTGTTATLSSNRLLITAPSSGASWGYVYQAIRTQIGKRYKLSLYYDRGSVDGRVLVRNDSTNSASGSILKGVGTTSGYKDLTSSDDAKYFFGSFTATANTSYILLYAKNTSGGTSAYDQISVTEEIDHSYKDKGLSVFGRVPKQVVATGADLVSYGPFSTTNYLQQPYNADLLFGTSDWCVSGWVKNNSDNASVYEDIITFGNIGQVGYSNMEPGSWLIQMNKSVGFNMYYKTSSGTDDSGWTAHNASGSLDRYHYNGLDVWYKITITKRGDRIYTYTNAEFIGSKGTVGSMTTSSNLNDMRLTIGYEGGNSYGPYFAQFTKMALWKISKSSPSHEQIKKMYDDEKHLFQENAKCTLYGSSDAVTALGYDDSTNILYAGTSAGRSEFQGLRRINNTTTAVTTAISASNGLVAEQ